jgi:uncharacterized protein YutE (UPF0331/DUF86 family)
MSPVDKDVITRKLAVIVRNLGVLEEISVLSPTEYGEDLIRRKAAERLLQELIEAAIDINTHIIVERGGMVPDSYYDGFIGLASLRVLPPQLARALAPSAGLRNRLVHEYDAIDDSIIYGAAKEAPQLYSAYVREIMEYIKRA